MKNIIKSISKFNKSLTLSNTYNINLLNCNRLECSLFNYQKKYYFDPDDFSENTRKVIRKRSKADIDTFLEKVKPKFEMSRNHKKRIEKDFRKDAKEAQFSDKIHDYLIDDKQRSIESDVIDEIIYIKKLFKEESKNKADLYHKNEEDLQSKDSSSKLTSTDESIIDIFDPDISGNLLFIDYNNSSYKAEKERREIIKRLSTSNVKNPLEDLPNQPYVINDAIKKFQYENSDFKKVDDLSRNKSQYKNIIYSPLKEDEVKLLSDLNMIDNNVLKAIHLGGRELLKNEFEYLKNKINENPSNSLIKEETTKLIDTVHSELKNFQPLNEEDIEYIKNNFPYFFKEENNAKYRILKLGKPAYISLKKLKESNKESLLNLKNNLNNLYNKILLTYKSKEKLKQVKASYNENIKYIDNNLKTVSKLVEDILAYLDLNQEKLMKSINSNSQLKLKVFDYINNYYLEDKNYLNEKNSSLNIHNISIIKGLSSKKQNNLTKDYYIYDDTNEVSDLRMFKLNENKIDSLKSLEFNNYYTNYINENFNDLELSDERVIIRVTLKVNNTKDTNQPSSYVLLDNEVNLPYNKGLFLSLNFPEVLNYYTFDNDSWTITDINGLFSYSNNISNTELVQNYYSKLYEDILVNHNFLAYFDTNIASIIAGLYEEPIKISNFNEINDKFDNIAISKKNKDKSNKIDNISELDNINNLQHSYKIIKPNYIKNKDLNYVDDNVIYAREIRKYYDKNHNLIEMPIESRFFKDKLSKINKAKKLYNQFNQLILSIKLSPLLDTNYESINNELDTLSNYYINYNNSSMNENDKLNMYQSIRNLIDNLNPFKFNDISLLDVC